jgi:hypothetical protein
VLLAWSTVSPAKFARPLPKLTVVEPPRVPPPGLLARVKATDWAKLGSTLPYRSSAANCRPNGLPAVMVDGGGVVNTNSVAPSAATVNGLVVTAGSPEPDTCMVRPMPALSRLRPPKVAMPPDRVAVTGPKRLPSAWLLVGATARLPL